MSTPPSPAIATVMKHGKSILPDGAIEFKNGILFQRATVIYHRACDGFGPGIREEWFPVTGLPMFAAVLQDPSAPPG